MTFAGFDPAALALLDALPTWDADRYAAAKQQLRDGVVGPGGDLVAAVADQLDADLTVDPRRSVSPLHRDMRFAADGAPRYKDHLLLTTWEGGEKSSSPTLWIRIDATRAGFASGVAFSPAVRDRWRAAVGGPAGDDLDASLRSLTTERAAEIAGDQLARVPRGFPDDHPRADLLRRAGFQVRFVEPLPRSVGQPAFAEWCAARLEALLPVHRWLVAEVAGDRPMPTDRR